MDVAANMRRLFGSRGGGGRHAFLIAEEADGPLVNDKDREACATYKKSKKQGVGPKGKMVALWVAGKK